MPSSLCPFCGDQICGDQFSRYNSFAAHLIRHGFTKGPRGHYLCICGFDLDDPTAYVIGLKVFREHMESLTEEEREEHLLMFRLGAVLTTVL